MNKAVMSTTMYVILFFALCYATILTLSYQDDKLVCLSHGYTSNSISLSLDGYCSKEVAPDVSESIPVENVSLHLKRKEHMIYVADCVFSRLDPLACRLPTPNEL